MLSIQILINMNNPEGGALVISSLGEALGQSIVIQYRS